jgi:hypothetical protein
MRIFPLKGSSIQLLKSLPSCMAGSADAKATGRPWVHGEVQAGTDSLGSGDDFGQKVP